MRRVYKLDENDIADAIRMWLFSCNLLVDQRDGKVALRHNGTTAPPDPPYAASETVAVWAEVEVDDGKAGGGT